jgi:uncharacterized protein YjbJ (UPF0337 family)
MRFRAREPLFSILFDTGLELLDSVRECLPDNMDDIKGRVRDTYGTASRRVGRASNALRGQEDSQILGKAADKVTDFSDKIRENVEQKPPSATGTHGE